jgi:hypothetical protein
MFDAAALVLEEIAPEDKNRNEVLRNACCSLHRGEEVGHGRSGCQPSGKDSA